MKPAGVNASWPAMFARMLTIRAAGQIPTIPKPFDGRADVHRHPSCRASVGLSSDTGPSSEIRSITPGVSAFGFTPVSTRQITAAGPGGVALSRKSARAALACAVISTWSAAAGAAPSSASGHGSGERSDHGRTPNHVARQPSTSRCDFQAALLRGDAGEQAAGGLDREVAVVGEAEVEAAGHVVVRTVAEVAGDEGGGEVRGDDDDVPLAAQRVVGVEGGAADARGRFGGEADAERADERGVGGEALVAGGAARGEVAGLLEGGEDDGGLALGGDLGLEVLGDREQELLGAAARADAGGDRVVRARGARRGGGAAGRAWARRRPASSGSGPGRPNSQPWP